MEDEIGIASSLISPPKKDFMSLAKAQLGFMNMFAIPLFQGVADVLPTMQYAVAQLEANKALFEKQVEEIPGIGEERRKRLTEGILSPRSLSFAIQPEDVQEYSARKNSTRSADYYIIRGRHAELRKAGSSFADHSNHIPNIPARFKEVNGASTAFDNMASFATGDPFHMNGSENRVIGHNGKQRSSEATEGSNSVPCTGDWQSQATSATTGKMPISPSTQGTSILSQDSIEGRSSAPTTATTTAPDASNIYIPPVPPEPTTSEEDSNGSTLKLDRSLKKKTSRFRMNALNLFRRNRATSPPRGGDFGS